MKKLIKVEDYILENKRKIFLHKISKHAISVKFEKLFNDESLTDMSVFVIKPKQAYYNNMDSYTPYVDYFIEFYDTDNEVLVGYFKMKFQLDRGDTIKYNINTLKNDLSLYVLTPTVIEKIKEMVEYNYSIKLTSKTKYKYEAIEFSDEHGKILLQTSMAIKIILPIVTHFIYSTKNMKTDVVLAEVFSGILEIFQGDNNMYNKFYEFVISKINNSKQSDKSHWEKLELFGNDISGKTEDIIKKLIVDILYKYNFKENIIAMNTRVVRKNMFWICRESFDRNIKPITNIPDSEGLSDFDRLEMAQSRFDESTIVIGRINIQQTISKLCKRYEVKTSNKEIEYYIHNLVVQDIQKDIIFNIFANYFGNRQDFSLLSIEDYAKLIIILKKLCALKRFKIIQHLISGNMHINPHIKKLPKKLVDWIEKSDRYKTFKKKYKSTFDIVNTDNGLFDIINSLISCRVYAVDYKDIENRGAEICVQDNATLIIDEYFEIITEMI